MEFTLVLYIYAGMFAKGDSVALTTVTGFPTEQACNDAGNASKSLVAGSSKEFRFKCYSVVKGRQ